ncbi:hypothetical protein ACIBP4_12175 [Micromonospora maritima]|uniref:Uncharacterized protein n=1 Tax=Micromonospora maritima TaxID=986711 RepID=A0ABW7ZM72_9ACTN
MTPEAVDTVLADLAATADRLITESAMAQRELDECNDDNERWFTQVGLPAGHLGYPNPSRALSSVRLAHATDRARLLRQSARRIVAWWADLATYAVLSTVAGQPIDPVRAAGADLSAHLTDEELHHLPGPSQDVRTLARLAAFFAGPSVNPDAPADPPMDAGEYASRAGLILQRSPSGEMDVVDDPLPDARLRRMWGDTWVDYQMSALLPADELAAAITAAGVPLTVVDTIRTTTRAVDVALAAAVRLAEPEDAAAVSEAEEEALWEHVERTTDLLAAYARTLTSHLPAIRRAAQQRACR